VCSVCGDIEEQLNVSIKTRKGSSGNKKLGDPWNIHYHYRYGCIHSYYKVRKEQRELDRTRGFHMCLSHLTKHLRQREFFKLVPR